MIVTEILQGCLLEYMHKIDPIPDENGSHRCDLDSMKLERLSHLAAQDVQGKDIVLYCRRFSQQQPHRKC